MACDWRVALIPRLRTCHSASWFVLRRDFYLPLLPRSAPGSKPDSNEKAVTLLHVLIHKVDTDAFGKIVPTNGRFDLPHTTRIV